MCVKQHSFQATTILQFALVYRPWVPSCWPCLWVVPPLPSIPSNNHKYVCSILLFHLVPESRASLRGVRQVASPLNPSMLTTPSFTSTPSKNHKHVCSILLFYLVLSFQVTTEPQFTLVYHLWVPECWPWLWVVPLLSSIPIKKRTPFYSFTLTMSSRMLSQYEVCLNWNSLHITTVFQFALVHCPRVPICSPCLCYITIHS